MGLEPSRYQDPRTWKMTPAMLRARRPFFARNMAALVLLLGTTSAIYTYTYGFLHRDNDFVDVPIPPVDEGELEQLKQEYAAHLESKK
ncbi:Coa3p KNAG_0C01740 [Huiozyma naganishii CBS 8797]|uniref:Cytochrome c oxidase assembly factor 3 n=1 Tax=Huiozyma naganishii (strain ATCC MYA-139 / BCRC 22969 / CBS 8797 / KCTC 17520 / NBRC 10181 / NCYC 3082 / Yp74L-3) TaxID=1071383 RepID=J7RIC8_HUIN7|nr:hypothetical protein KNAG_0C01740 [Kazachstania naganishii CBS 8797]CCK69288.1 hypothetical protein KNAG_0C01740 [Kazachstania naganishii CBS 8797]